MTVVPDASVVVAMLVDSGPDGEWAAQQLRSARLAAPHLLPGEVANVLRRFELTGDLTSDVASLAFADLADLPVEYFPFEPLAERIWELRASVTAYDGWYVALAEAIDGTLVTLDDRLAAAPGPDCRILTPGS